MSTIIETQCHCGEPVLVETGLANACRRDGKRPHHPSASANSTQFRCRACRGWLGDTCEAASFDTQDPQGENHG